MHIGSTLSGHWTDEELVAHLYGIGPENGHLEGCEACEARLGEMQARRESLEASKFDDEDSFFLAAQRRRIYAKLAEPLRWWSGLNMRRWASAGVAALVLGGSVLYYQEHEGQRARDAMLSDEQLVQDVSSLSDNADALPTAPVQALFE